MTEEQLTARDALYQRVAKIVGYPGHWFNPSASPHCEVAMNAYVLAQGYGLLVHPSPGGTYAEIFEPQPDDIDCPLSWCVRPTRPEAIAGAIESMDAGNG